MVMISIIVPVYNVKLYLCECLNSIIAQTYRNTEIILVDDGSTDGSGAICDEYAERDSRIRVIHKSNGGVATARNEGIKACSGELIGFIDADDWIDKDMYMNLSKACRCADMAACGYISYPAGLETPIFHGRKEKCLYDFEEAVIQMYERNGYFTSVCNKLFKRNVIMPGGVPILFEQDLYIGEDELWLVQVMKNCKSFMFVEKPCYHYRPRAGSATWNKSLTKKRMSVLIAKNKVIQELERYERAKAYAQSVLYNECFWMLTQSYINGEREKQIEIQRTIKREKKAWLKASNIPKINKLKYILLEMEIFCRLPVSLVEATNSINRYSIKYIFEEKKAEGINPAESRERQG